MRQIASKMLRMGSTVATASRLTRTEANRLRACRVAAGLSQRGLAAASGVTRMTIQRVERGENVPTPSTLAALAFALQVSVWDLLPHPDPHDRLAPERENTP
jgi:transcriptional regulator with XRE-family HTH domain